MPPGLSCERSFGSPAGPASIRKQRGSRRGVPDMRHIDAAIRGTERRLPATTSRFDSSQSAKAAHIIVPAKTARRNRGRQLNAISAGGCGMPPRPPIAVSSPLGDGRRGRLCREGSSCLQLGNPFLSLSTVNRLTTVRRRNPAHEAVGALTTIRSHGIPQHPSRGQGWTRGRPIRRLPPLLSAWV
jgi:hypothetical protein